LQPNDEYILWSLLARTLCRPDNEQPELLATPYWMLKQLGMQSGGAQYVQLRDSLDRLASVSYHNDAFYHPLRQELEWVTFSFFSIWLPMKQSGGEVDTDRLWRIEWNATFYELARATGGNLLFDLDLFRKLTPAARRLFLKLSDRFWRSGTVYMNVDDLTINGLGFSAERPLYKRRYDLQRCLEELLDHRIISLGRGQTSPRQLFIKRGKGSYVVVFYEGSYFRQPTSVDSRPQIRVEDDELYEPMKAIGFNDQAIRVLFTNHSRGLIQRWVRITETAMRDAPRGFAGFKRSPAAFCRDGIQNNRMPPDWMHDHEKRVRDAQWQREQAERDEAERQLRDAYQAARLEALERYLCTDGRAAFEAAYEGFKVMYQQTSPHTYQEEARRAAMNKIETQSFQFPEYNTWVMMNQSGGVNA